jgi:hypothetical protein
MRIHLLYGSEIEPERYQSLLGLLQSVPGPLRFIEQRTAVSLGAHSGKYLRNVDPKKKVEFPDVSVNEEYMSFGQTTASFHSRTYPDFHQITDIISLPWDTFFDECRKYRKSRDLGDDEFVVLLTDYANDNNWFSAPDMKGGRNMFVQTSGWGAFSHGDWRYPVLYQIVTNILRQLMIKNLSELTQIMHPDTKGCMNDFNKNKQYVHVKLRTADICSDCTRIIQERVREKNIVLQVMSFMDLVRTHVLFRSRFVFTGQPSRLSISNGGKCIEFTDPHSSILNVPPKQKLVFLFFLRHPEGVAHSELVNHREELTQIYQRLRPNQDQEDANSVVGRLVDPQENDMNEMISRLNKTLVTELGPEIAEHYCISGDRGGIYKIGLDRNLVGWE